MSLNGIVPEPTYRIWWKYIDVFCRLFFSSPYSSLVRLCGPLSTHFEPVIRLSCWSNWSWDISCSTHIPLLWGFWILIAVVTLWVGFIVCQPVVLAVMLIIWVHIPVKLIVGIGSAFSRTVLTTFRWMEVNSSSLAYIQSLSSSCREVLCTQTLWHRWSFWQFKCSGTIM